MRDADSSTGDVKETVQPSTTDIAFTVEELQQVELRGPDELMSRDLMSPYVWRDPDGRIGIMVRAVQKLDTKWTDTGQIWAGWSADGVSFDMLAQPSLVPGPDDRDIGGVEDPTVLIMPDKSYVVYYTGVAADMTHGEMFYACGPSPDQLTKTGVALASTKTMGNTKEATVVRTRHGQWALFYEYAAEIEEGRLASRIGLAVGPSVAGPWQERPTPFMPREDSWDNWHLSPGPVLMDDPDRPVMFYNGATKDARWRIGWVAFDRKRHEVLDRCIEPLITPPPVDDRTATDIAFAASIIEQDGNIWLYYSLEDRKLARARLRRWG